MESQELIGPIMPMGPVIIAVDVEGGDACIKEYEKDKSKPLTNTHIVTKGVIAALEAELNMECVLFGDNTRVSDTLKQGITEKRFKFLSKSRKIGEEVLNRISVVHTDDADNISQGTTINPRRYNNYKNASMFKAVNSVGSTTDAVLSAGNTGTYATISVFKLKRKKGTSLSLSIVAPNKGNSSGEVLLLDAGLDDWGDKPVLKNVAGKMLTDALEAIKYLEETKGIISPKVGILNVGSEKGKGRVIEKNAEELLNEHPNVNYVGFIEGDDITNCECDIIVTDGDSGNKVLKTGEGMSKLILGSFSDVFKKTGLRGLISQFLLQWELRELKKFLNPNKNPLGLINGLRGIAGKNHGGSDEEGFEQGLIQLYNIARIDKEKKIRVKAQKSFSENAGKVENTED